MANHIESIWLQDFRCFENLELFFTPGLNWLYGANGSGKTSILEAVYWCGRARSFRTNKAKSLIATNKNTALIRLAWNQHYLGSEISSDKPLLFRFKQQNLKRTSDLMSLLSVQFLGPQSHKLVEPESESRKRWLDWSLFHVKHEYLNSYQQVKRCLIQRNNALRQNDKKLAHAFDQQLSLHTIHIETQRTLFIQKLNLLLKTLMQMLKLSFPLQVHYISGLPNSVDGYRQLLVDNFNKDIERGFTWHTASRSRFVVSSNDKPSSEVLSRGQQKLAAFLLLLGQQRLVQSKGLPAVLLVDDLHAELDSQNRQLLSSFLNDSNQQVLVTSTEPPDKGMKIAKLFHVEQGKVSTLSQAEVE